MGLGVGAGASPVTIDVDSTVCEVQRKAKQGAAYAYTRQLSDHPMLAIRADTGENLHAGLRTGPANTQRGAKRFVEEPVACVRCAGATGPVDRQRRLRVLRPGVDPLPHPIFL